MLSICIIFSVEYYWLLHRPTICTKLLSKAQHSVINSNSPHGCCRGQGSPALFTSRRTVSKEIWLVSYECGRLCIFLPSLTSPMTRAVALTNRRSKCWLYVNMVSAPFRHFPYPASLTSSWTLAGSWIMIGQGHTCSDASLLTKNWQEILPLWLLNLTWWPSCKMKISCRLILWSVCTNCTLQVQLPC